ncbi:PLG [Mytilus edulis]|uniref:PLG n=1 Tax=Mytilus edulis TaxID=6550 RepID=A0A8S3PXI9_MYTED|nr:PLG [Mytilus edulis]
MAMLLHILPCFLIMSHCYQIQEEQFTVWQGYRLNNTVIVELSVEVQNINYCASKCVRSPHCNAASYNDLSKACELHRTIYSTIFITNDTDENQYLAIPKDIYTTTNFAETVQFETTEDKSLSTAQETALETSTIISQQKNWTILGGDACGVDERLPVVPTDTTSLFHVGKFIGMVFTCDTLSPGTSVDHCPVSQCGSDDQWTTGYSVSCTAMPAGHPDKNTNYCRDPDNTGAPWCYATDPNVIWEFCPVPKC